MIGLELKDSFGFMTGDVNLWHSQAKLLDQF